MDDILKISRNDEKNELNMVCGKHAILLFSRMNQTLKLKSHLIAYETSGDNDNNENYNSVSYAGIIFDNNERINKLTQLLQKYSIASTASFISNLYT